MAKMRVISITMWGDDGVQVDFRTLSPVAGFEVNHTEMAMPVNAAEFSRLQAVNLYDEFDVVAKASVAS